MWLTVLQTSRCIIQMYNAVQTYLELPLRHGAPHAEAAGALVPAHPPSSDARSLRLRMG